MKADRETVKIYVERWNESIDRFMEEKLPQLLAAEGVEVKDSMIPMNGWFKAQEIIRNQNFRGAAEFLMKLMRDDGHDVRIDMQTYKLVLY